MSDDKLHRAARAKELLSDPVLKEAYDELEKATYLNMLRLKPDDHEGRWAAVCEINAVRALQARLATYVNQAVERQPIKVA